MPRPLYREPSGVSALGVFILLIVALIAITATYYTVIIAGPPAATLRAQEGDSVTVDYVGYFSDTELLFDTTMKSVAEDNATFSKAFVFNWRPRWQPLSFTIGDGSLVRGFDEAVKGLVIGETRTVIVPPADAYGAADPSRILVRPILEPVPVRITMNTTEFQAKYGTPPFSGINVTDPFWGWNAIVSVGGTTITVTNSPTVGQEVRPYGAWDAQVVGIDDAANQGDGIIWVRHILEATMVDRVGGESNGQKFALRAVNLDEGTYTMDFNVPGNRLSGSGQPIVGFPGRTLVFQITLRGLTRF